MSFARQEDVSSAPGGGSVQRDVVDDLGRRIATGRLAADSSLVTDDLTAQYGASRVIVREALRALEARGMIRARHRVGTVVQSMSHWNRLDPAVIAWRGDGPDADRQLDELWVLREAVEPVAAARAAAHPDGETLRELSDLVVRMREAAASGDADAFARSDTAFHRLIAEASGNPYLLQLADTVEAGLTRRYSDRRVFSDLTPASIARHEAIARAIGARDPETAAAEARALIAEARVELHRRESTR